MFNVKDKGILKPFRSYHAWKDAWRVISPELYGISKVSAKSVNVLEAISPSSPRGTVDSFAKWAELVNDSSYLFPNILPYYQKSPHYTPFNASLYQNATNAQSPSSFSPSGGPLQVSFSNAVDPFGTWVLQLYQAFGMGLIPGFNDGALLGSAFMTSTVDPTTGIRSSSSSSFLQTALQRNLAPIIYTNTLAERILFTNSTTPRATAIRVTTAGTFGTPSLTYTLTARRSLILSGGAIQSPQLLLVSGIGNCTALSTPPLSIPCTAHLPGVGANLQDHVLFGTSHRVHLQTASAALSNVTLADSLIATYQATASGPLSLPGTGVVGWEKLPAARRAALSNTTRSLLDTAFPPDWPEIEWLPMSALYGTGDAPTTTDPRDGANYATLNTALVAPLSRGSVRIASAEMSTPPLIDPGWLSHAGDREVAVQAVRRQREMWGWLAARGVAEGEEYYPGEDVVSSDAEIVEWLKRAASTVNHASCTCKMGTRDDAMAVVDAEGRVFGVEGLRVVDASSFPFLPPGHPQSTVYMLAEKIAEGILVEEGLVGDGGLSVPVAADNCVG
ncbi:Dehydrogenase patE [Lasiodiplodia hormozganensis]|uniref:Dehydrogenase patE n=1 Tax=Lasiodiplodia hormozganensis TaxID=869390 RepID=A0AA40CTL3_9PEZI|nr:Dehydrogenase patE [Lasiodiplodia hormozganensis]